VADADLSAVYSGALAFVFPSLYEGFGLTVLEAMQCGTPVITSNTTSIPEVTSDAGILIDPTDSDALCVAMISVLHDPVLREDLSARGIRRAQAFNWSKTAELTAQAYSMAACG
jgi:glycosyltransferase involved in cell wall biosynthesis